MFRVERQPLQVQLHVCVRPQTGITAPHSAPVLGRHEEAASLGRALAIAELLGEHVQIDVVELVDVLRERPHVDHVHLGRTGAHGDLRRAWLCRLIAQRAGRVVTSGLDRSRLVLCGLLIAIDHSVAVVILV